MNKFFQWCLLSAMAPNAFALDEMKHLPTDLLPEQVVVGPAFDCGKAASRVERTICNDGELARLDQELSKVFAQVMDTAVDRPARRREQRRWLAQRDRCADAACLVEAYRSRMMATAGGGLTNPRVRAICGEAVRAINDGTIAARLLRFRDSSAETQRRWRETHPRDHFDVSGALTLVHKGRKRSLGMLSVGGSAPRFIVVDIEGRAAVDHLEEPRKWGLSDHVLMVQGELIVVTGEFREGSREASLVAWLAPDGAARTICSLQETGAMGYKESPGAVGGNVCNAVAGNRVEAVRWDETPSVEGGGTGPEWRWDKAEVAHFDLDMDGEKEAVGRFMDESGAGCGGTRQWLHVLGNEQQDEAARPTTSVELRVAEPQRLGEGFPVPFQPSTLEEPPAVASYRVAHTALGESLNEHSRECVRRSEPSPSRFAMKLFEFDGRTYLLSGGESLTARVRSFWGGDVRTWCEFDLFPQYKVETYHFIETWPVPPLEPL